MTAEIGTCAITGANGYVGGCLKVHLRRHGWRIIEWARRSEPGTDAVAFQLGEEVDPCRLAGVRTLIHCAYDFAQRSWPEIQAINVVGSERLFRAAHVAGVGRIVFISSLSAFDGCRSLYGRAKLEIEAHARAVGALVIRPGLVYGDQPGGMFGRLVDQVEKSRVLAVLQGGRQTQYLIHEQDLGALVRAHVSGQLPAVTDPVAAASAQGWELREILRAIGRTLGRQNLLVPVPWWLVWSGLKTLEAVGVRTRFRSDSLVSLIHQHPSPSFAALAELGIGCRAFQVTPAMVTRQAAPTAR